MTDSLEFEQFLEATCTILQEDGFGSYLPTLFVDEEFLVVEGIPEHVSDTDALNDLGPEYGLGEPGTYFAVLVAADTVIAGESGSSGWNFVSIHTTESGLVVSQADRPEWFKL
jgi:hypothetical protein